MIPNSYNGFRDAAKRALPRFLFDYIDGGAGDETTMRANHRDLDTIGVRQRVLKDVSSVSLQTRLFGTHVSMPVALAPIGLAGMCARRGEVQAARAASSRGVPFCLSTVSVCALEEVAPAAGAPIWFQLYVVRDRGFMRDLIARAKAMGATAMIFTVDMPVPGARRRDVSSGLSGPRASSRRMLQALSHPRWTWDVGIRGRPHHLGNLAPILGRSSGMEDFMAWLARNFDPSIQWRDLDWIREAWDGPLIIKGILDPEDARDAVSFGADGLVVSNHGGRQLDGARSTARALPSVVDAVERRASVLVDSGIRSGLDVVRMMALGADGVLLGRAWVYALAAAGEEGVASLLGGIEHEMRTTMALAGLRSLAEISADIVDDR